MAYPCAKPEELEAIRIRALQTELMMAGLSCNGKKHYNRFVKQNRTELKSYAKSLRGYFERNFSSNAETEMDAFITKLANDSSKRSLKNGAKSFCADASTLFKTISKEDDLSDAKYRYRGDISECW
jgi:hypothetical protein